VVEAWDHELQRVVAIKELLRDSPGARARFRQEIALTARIQHPGVIPLYDVLRDPDGGERYAMRPVAGRTLAEAVAATPDPAARLALLPHVLAVADALAAAHAEGVVHRDVKPQNILLGPFGETLLIDWGVAKDLRAGGGAPLGASGWGGEGPEREPGGGADAHSLTQVGAVVGTPAFMAPEQARGEPVGPAADVYALGATLYHTLSGQAPQGPDAAAALRALREGQPPPPLGALVPGLPADLGSIVARAMHPDPARRYPGALELSADLRRFSAGQLVAARRYGRAELLRRWLRRHRAPVGVAAAALVLLGAVGAWSAARVVAERDAAEAARADAEARAHALVLAHARRGRAADPTEAAAWLAEYPLSARGWPALRPLAQELAARGVARWAARPHADACDGLQFGALGDVVYPWGFDTRPLSAATGAPLPGEPWRRVELALPLPGGDMLRVGPRGQVERVGPDGLGRPLHTLDAMPDLLVIAGPQALVSDKLGRLTAVDLGSGAARRLLGEGPALRGIGAAGGAWAGARPDGSLWRGSLAGGDAGRWGQHDEEIALIEVAADGAVVLGDTTGGLFAVGDGGAAQPLARLPAAITALALSGDGRWIAAADGDRGLVVLDRRGGAPLSPPWAGVRVRSLAWSPAEALLAVTLHDGALLLWRPDTGEVHRRGSLGGQHGAAAFSPDGAAVAACGVDGSARLWAVPPRGPEVFRGHGARVFHLVFLPAGRVASDSDDRTVRLWTPGAPEGQVLRGHTDRAYGLDLSPDGRRLASAGVDGVAWVWDLDRGAGVPLEGHRGRVHRAVFLPDGGGLVTAGQDGALRRWSVDGAPGAQVMAHTGAITWAAPSRDGAQVWSVGVDRRLVRWDLRSGALDEVAAGLGPRGGHTLRVFPLAGGEALTCPAPDALAVYGPGPPRRLPLPAALVCASMVLAPDGSWAAAPAGPDVWIVPLDGGPARRLPGGDGDVHSLAVSPDGALLASAALDGAARVWRVADGAGAVAWWSGGPLLGVAFRADGRALAAAGVDSEVWVGPVDPAALLPADPAGLHAAIAGWSVSPPEIGGRPAEPG
jgi:WD40 repeat protein